jgi:glycosyltransferase involved in cell wall biosynthesis
MKNYSDITIVIKTFLRPKVCVKTIKVWNNLYPNISMIVVDDGDDNLDLQDFQNIKHIKTKFNIGLSAGRNLGVNLAQTDFVFVADDDDIPSSTHNIIKCKQLLIDNNIDIIGSGAFNMYYQKNYNILVKEMSITDLYRICDITKNHFLAKNKDLPLWPESIKIKREHCLFFKDCKTKNLKTAGTNLLNFCSQRKYPPRYSSFKNQSKKYSKIVRQDFGINRVVWEYLKGKRVTE